MKRISSIVIVAFIVLSTFSILAPQTKAEPEIVRAWKDDTSLGLENEHLLLHGSAVSGNYRWFFDYLIFKDTGTMWYQPWDELAIIVYPIGSLGPWTVGADYEITASTEADRAYLTYSVTKDNLKQDVTYTIYPSEPYIHISFSITNIGSSMENTWAGVQFTTWIAGDYANDYYCVPGYGERQFTGGTNDIHYTDATETWVATWDKNKEEGAGILSTQGFAPSNIMSIDWGVGEGFRFSSENFDLAPSQSSELYDCYIYFFAGTGWQQAKDFYDFLVLEPSPFENYAKLAETRADAYTAYADIVYYYSSDNSEPYNKELVITAFETLIPVLIDLSQLTGDEIAQNVPGQIKNTAKIIMDFKDWLDGLEEPIKQMIDWITYGYAAKYTYDRLVILKDLCEQEADAWRNDLDSVKALLEEEESEIGNGQDNHALAWAEEFEYLTRKKDYFANEIARSVVDFLFRDRKLVGHLKQEKIFDIEVRCFVDLHIYDEEGNHNGPIYDEGVLVGIEENIPNSCFVGIEGESQFALIYEPTNTYIIEVFGKGNNTPSEFELELIYYDENGTTLFNCSHSDSIDPGEKCVFTSEFSEASFEFYLWQYFFKDSRRGTELRINTEDKYFQFVAPDKTFSVKYDTDMKVFSRIIIICYEDDEMRLIATAVDEEIDFCSAIAKDKQTGKYYVLIDKPNWRSGGHGVFAR